MLLKIIFFVLLLWPFVVAGVVDAVYLQPEGDELIVREAWLPSQNMVDINKVAFDDTKSVSLEEFRELGIAEPTTMLIFGYNLHLKLIYVGKADNQDGTVQQYKAETKVEPKYGQYINWYEFDYEKQLVTVDMQSRVWLSGDLFWGAFDPSFLYACSGIWALAASIVSWKISRSLWELRR